MEEKEIKEVEEVKTQEVQAKEVKAEEVKMKEVKAEEVKAEPSSQEQAYQDVIEFSEKPEDKKEEEEITFAFSSKKSSVSKRTADSSDGGDYALASSNRHRLNEVMEKVSGVSGSKKPPTAVFAAIAVLAICGITGGVIAALSSNRTVETEASVQSSVASETESSHLSVPFVPSDAAANALPIIQQESAEIKTIDTRSITFGNGVTVAGIDLTGKTLSEAYDAMQDRLLELRDKINISITCDGSKNITLTEDNFKFDTDIANVLIQAYHYSRGELDTPTVQTTTVSGATDFTVTTVVNKDSVKAAVKAVAEQFDIQPVDAHVEKFMPDQAEKFKFADGSDGYLINQNEVNNQITDILTQASKTGSFSIETTRTPYKVSLAEVKANTKLIASHRTTAANVWASNYNMQLAIQTANGTIVNPGETFSFNTMTGDTTNGDLGYVPSTAIVKGKYEQQYGGGICQASTTLYLCALKADMEVIERHAHQFPSSYADRGLDATVDYGNLDMRFKNNKDFPIYIATYVYDYNGDGLNELMVEMYGPLSTEYDEIVPVGWVTYAGSSTYSAKGAKVYFKNGKEIKREILPSGSYDYHYDDYYTALSMIPNDPENGPANVSPTYSTPTIYSPSGCGSSAPVDYGKAADYLSKALTAPANNNSSKPAETSNSASSR